MARLPNLDLELSKHVCISSFLGQFTETILKVTGRKCYIIISYRPFDQLYTRACMTGAKLVHMYTPGIKIL